MYQTVTKEIIKTRNGNQSTKRGGGKLPKTTKGKSQKANRHYSDAEAELSHRGSAIRRRGRPRCHHGAVGLEGGEHEAAAKESVDSCNRATGTRHGAREKQPEKYKGGDRSEVTSFRQAGRTNR